MAYKNKQFFSHSSNYGLAADLHISAGLTRTWLVWIGLQKIRFNSVPPVFIPLEPETTQGIFLSWWTAEAQELMLTHTATFKTTLPVIWLLIFHWLKQVT